MVMTQCLCGGITGRTKAHLATCSESRVSGFLKIGSRGHDEVPIERYGHSRAEGDKSNTSLGWSHGAGMLTPLTVRAGTLQRCDPQSL
jgi:hypothetical protein